MLRHNVPLRPRQTVPSLAVADPGRGLFFVFLATVILWSASFLASVSPAFGQDEQVVAAPDIPTPEDNPVSPIRRIERSKTAGDLVEATKSGGGQGGGGQGGGGQGGGGQGGGGQGGGGQGGGGQGGGGQGGGGQGGGAPTGFRTIDGSGNNVDDPLMGAAHSQLFRSMESDYSDGIAALAGADRISPRAVSNRVSAQSDDIPNDLRVTDYLWQWGQFLDHDIDLTDGADPAEPADIAVPAGDPWFDPTGAGGVLMSFNRSIYDPDSGIDSPRQQINEITAWIDASNVYGSDAERNTALRTLDGTGKLKVSDGDLLPFNTPGLPNAGGPAPTLFLAGDVRANEQAGLAAMHTLWVREHNRQAERIAERNPELDGEEIYQRARRHVGALMQVITYREFLPALLGPRALSPYRGYRPDVNGSIANLFSTAAYRFGHSTLSSTILRLDSGGNEVAAGHLALRDAFFSPQRLTDEGGIDPILRGLAAQTCQAVDPYVVDDLRNFLFGPPGSGGFDLVSLNIQRGRDHGLPSYNDARQAFGMRRARTFADITSHPELRQRLQSAYDHPNDIDLWVGGLAEDSRPGAMVGELWFRIFKDQFEALRDGDRYWYARVFDGRDRERLESTRLSDVIRRNTEIGDELQNDVFHMPR